MYKDYWNLSFALCFPSCMYVMPCNMHDYFLSVGFEFLSLCFPRLVWAFFIPEFRLGYQCALDAHEISSFLDYILFFSS